MNLFNIATELQAAYELAATGDDADLETAAEIIMAYEPALEDKADNYAALISVIDGEINTIKAERDRLMLLEKARTNFKERLKSDLYGAMTALDRPKFKTTLHSFTIQKNPPAVGIFDETAIPSQYFTQPAPVISKSAIMDALKRGEAVPGATLTQGESLRIR